MYLDGGDRVGEPDAPELWHVNGHYGHGRIDSNRSELIVSPTINTPVRKGSYIYFFSNGNFIIIITISKTETVERRT